MTGPHHGQPVRWSGTPLERASTLVVLVHGRGATAESILMLAAELDRPSVSYAAPQAAGSTWYPFSFLAPIEQNEPGLSSGLAAIDAVLRGAAKAGIPSERQVLIGFSQGACLALEYAARHARRFGAVLGFTGGLIGPPGTTWEYPGSFAGTPVYLGSADPDPHVPWHRVEETARVFERMGAAVTVRRFPGMGHTVHPDEIAAARELIDAIAA